jgi:hypothetical protein
MTHGGPSENLGHAWLQLGTTKTHGPRHLPPPHPSLLAAMSRTHIPTCPMHARALGPQAAGKPYLARAGSTTRLSSAVRSNSSTGLPKVTEAGEAGASAGAGAGGGGGGPAPGPGPGPALQPLSSSSSPPLVGGPSTPTPLHSEGMAATGSASGGYVRELLCVVGMSWAPV